MTEEIKSTFGERNRRYLALSVQEIAISRLLSAGTARVYRKNPVGITS